MSKAAAGKTIVLTGCTRGLGRAMAAYFVQAGATVIGCGRSDDQIDAMRREFGAAHDFDQVDVSDDAQVARWAKSVLAANDAPDLLINNAAVIAPNAPLWEVGADAFQRVIDVNICGVANTIRHFVPAMVARGSGVIVNFSSGWGRSTSPEVAPYCASKWAIEGLTKALAQELPPRLAAVALNPGIIDTEMLRSCFGSGAGEYPRAERWVRSAGPFLLSLGEKDNGASLTVPGAPTD
jgi:NAD(P)-dependent dehydrogenase (short-subunit alcohol dehydrogenase family)